MVTFAVFYGMRYGGILITTPLACAEYWGVQNLVTLMALPTLAFISGAASSATISGTMYDSTGSFFNGIMFAGSIFVVMFFVLCSKRHQIERM
jgi:hypothetical protein